MVMVYDYTIDISNDNTTHSKILKMVGRGKTILEIGCATGYMTRYMKEELECRVYGLEIDPEAAEVARPYCQELVIGDIEVMDLARIFSVRSFDVIIMADVLEHLKDAGKLLANLPGLLTPRGFILLSLPNGAHGSIGLEVLDGRWQYRQLGLLDKTHLRFFDKDGITLLLDEAGFYISRLQRIMIHPRDTEMKTPWDSYPREVTAYLEKVNPEFQTYQFVIKACPTDEQDGRVGLEDARQAEAERADRLEKVLKEKLKELACLRALVPDGQVAECLRLVEESRENLRNEQLRQERETAGIHKGYIKLIAELTGERKDLQLEVGHFRQQTDRLVGELAQASGIINDLQAKVVNLERIDDDAKGIIAALGESNDKYRAAGDEARETIALLQRDISWLQESLADQRRAHETSLASTAELQALNLSLTTQLHEMEQSLVWRIYTRYRRILNSILPVGSSRRRIYHWLVRAMTRPFLNVPLGPEPQPPTKEPAQATGAEVSLGRHDPERDPVRTSTGAKCPERSAQNEPVDR